MDPDWDDELNLAVSPRGIIHALFGSASTVHTGWESCADQAAVLAEVHTADASGSAYCRLVEQEFVDEDDPGGSAWHDWMVEVVINEVFISAHWQVPVDAPPMEWEWCANECEKAFTGACVLFGKRVRRGLGIEELPSDSPPKEPQTRH